MHDGNNIILYPTILVIESNEQHKLENQSTNNIPEQDMDLPNGWLYKNRKFNYARFLHGETFKCQYTMQGDLTFKEHFQKAVRKLLNTFPESRNNSLLSIYTDDGRLKSEVDINEPAPS
jgi:hypothetical protein